MFAVINTFLPLASDMSVLGNIRTIQPALQTGSTGAVQPSYTILSDAEHTAILALDAADIRRVRLSMFQVINLGAADSLGNLTPTASAALAEATQTFVYTRKLAGGV